MTKVVAFCSGGDAPGMNACLYGIAKAGLTKGVEVLGAEDGFRGLAEGDLKPLDVLALRRWFRRGGTVLGTSRYPAFLDPEVRAKTVSRLRALGISGVIGIGGDGTYHGLDALAKEGFSAIGIPGTIDNDIALTDFTLGFATAVSNCIEAIDKIRDTMEAHHRLFIVQVMGHHCGDLALYAGLASGADGIFYQGGELKPEELISKAKAQKALGKRDFLVVTSENLLDVPALARRLADETGYETRCEVLGHVQRGGNPVPQDRILGLTFGSKALSLLLEGKVGRAVGVRSGQIVSDELDAVLAGHKGLSPLDLAATERILS